MADKQYAVTEVERQWAKGTVHTFSVGNSFEVDYRYDGASTDGKQVYFRVGDLGLLSRAWAKLTRTEAGSEEIYNLGEFVSVVGLKSNPNDAQAAVEGGFTPLEFIAKEGEPDHILKVRDRLPREKIDS